MINVPCWFRNNILFGNRCTSWHHGNSTFPILFNLKSSDGVIGLHNLQTYTSQILLKRLPAISKQLRLSKKAPLIQELAMCQRMIDPVFVLPRLASPTDPTLSKPIMGFDGDLAGGKLENPLFFQKKLNSRHTYHIGHHTYHFLHTPT